jgi:tight adherence protein B
MTGLVLGLAFGAAIVLLSVSVRDAKGQSLIELVQEIESSGAGSQAGKKIHTSHVQQLVMQAGWQHKERQVLTVAVVLFLALAGILASILGVAIGIVGSLLATAGIIMWFARLRVLRRQKKIEKQLVPALTSMLSILQAGRPVNEAFEQAASHSKAPLAGELDMIGRMYKSGTPVAQAVAAAALHLDNPEFSLFATAIEIESHQGGDLTTLLARIISSVSTHIETRSELRAAVSESKLVRLLVGGFVPLMLVFFAVSDPGQIHMLTDSFFGWMITGAAAVLYALGLIVSGAMVKNLERQI